MLKNPSVIFWDFDGVIKDSVEVKADAYEKLFISYGLEVARRIREHHENNGGLSRFIKIPLYLTWAGEVPSPILIEDFCDRFSKAVMQATIDSPWVPGVKKYLQDNFTRQGFIIVTATPEVEILKILDTLAIRKYFREVHGAPKQKNFIISDILARWKLSPGSALMIGDSVADLEAAQINQVPFLLRRTSMNKVVQTQFNGIMIDNFNYE